MPIISPANQQLFFSQLETRFWTAFQAAEPWAMKIADSLPVNTEQWANGWAGMIDKAREWLGPRVAREMVQQTYLVPIQNFELTIKLDKFKIDDDVHAVYAPRAAYMGIQMAKLKDYQLRDLLNNAGSQTGARQVGFDGLNHWGAAHPVDFYDASKGTYINDFRGGGAVINGVSTGGGFSLNGFNTIWQEIASRKSESGEALGILADLTMLPPQLKAAGMAVLQAQFMGAPQMGVLGTGVGLNNGPMVGATENMMKGWTDLFVNPDLAAYPTTWYELVTKGPVKPFNWLERAAPVYVERTRDDDPLVFDQHVYAFGSMARGAPAWSFPWLSAISGP